MYLTSPSSCTLFLVFCQDPGTKLGPPQLGPGPGPGLQPGPVLPCLLSKLCSRYDGIYVEASRGVET